MYLGVIKKNGQLVKLVNINANDELTADKKLKAFAETFNDTTIRSQVINTQELDTISKLHYYD